MKNLIVCLSALSCAALTSSAFADRIVVFGATGSIGSAIVREALARGHDVVGVSRDPDNFSYTEESFTGVRGNPTILESVLEVTAGADMIINAVGGREAATPEESATYQSAIAFTEAFSDRGESGPHLVVVGGGLTNHGSLEKLVENLPPIATEGSTFRASYIGHWITYQRYLASNINWTLVAPPLTIVGFRDTPGEDVRTGNYRTSTEDFVIDSDGGNWITKSDLAVAIVDFAESAEFNQEKVSVGY